MAIQRLGVPEGEWVREMEEDVAEGILASSKRRVWLMSEEMAKVLIESAGGIILALLAAVLLLWLLVFHRDRILARLSRVRSVSFLGVEVQLDVEGRMDRAVEERPIEVSVSRTDKRAAIARAQNALPVLRGARVLWADDDPRGNLAEEELLRGFGVCIDHAVSTEEALTLLRRHRYDLVISDMKRGDDEHAGLGMCARLEAEDLARWTVFYVTKLEGEKLPGGVVEHPRVPPGALGITNRPDHLLHLVLDALERERWPLADARGR